MVSATTKGKPRAFYFFMDYRKIYENHYGIKIPDGFEIHHVNKDRNDNRIENLLLLPSRIHQSLHIVDNEITRSFIMTINFVSVSANNVHELAYIREYVEMWGKIIPALKYWASVKVFEDLAIQIGTKANGNLSYKRFRK